uniref:Uncharacterized protein n=1 Tax=Aegilops tauschii subsp. strangulata TaxID=200361 RepID=A0A453FZ20_AEGTS
FSQWEFEKELSTKFSCKFDDLMLLNICRKTMTSGKRVLQLMRITGVTEVVSFLREITCELIMCIYEVTNNIDTSDAEIKSGFLLGITRTSNYLCLATTPRGCCTLGFEFFVVH